MHLNTARGLDPAAADTLSVAFRKCRTMSQSDDGHDGKSGAQMHSGRTHEEATSRDDHVRERWRNSTRRCLVTASGVWPERRDVQSVDPQPVSQPATEPRNIGIMWHTVSDTEQHTPVPTSRRSQSRIASEP